MKTKILCLCLLAVFFCSCAKLNTHIPLKENENFFIIKTSDRQRISFNDFIDDISKSDIILLGEKHDNMYHRNSEIMIIKHLEDNLNKNNQKFNVAFEMFSNSNQSIINKAKIQKESINEKKLQKALNWDKAWNWEIYKDLISLVFYSNANIIGANLSKDEIAQIYQGVEPLNGILSTQNKIKQEIKKIISISHKIRDEKILEKLTEIQQFKDRRMADVLVNSKDKILLVAGMFHVSKKIGIPLHIKDFKSKKKISVVVFNIDPEDIEYQDGDYIFIFRSN
ncbi:ChaN family lipoprotein [Campylobacter insulaenigrae]|uniref:ChaN family lipoprotein n=1 Tax=Campylobacter insulaenigrae TaxID=260714 RepID=UPI0021536CBD|nr:ChaN family lipoprotein [Campylobacter insulaenigrae]MCR6584304.1 ChaN family lipoprotein [Campylobacter insulaenigrae]